MRVNFDLPFRKYCIGDEDKKLVSFRLPKALADKLKEVVAAHGWTQAEAIATILDRFIQFALKNPKTLEALKRKPLEHGTANEMVTVRLHKPLVIELKKLSKKLKWSSTDIFISDSTSFIQWIKTRKD